MISAAPKNRGGRPALDSTRVSFSMSTRLSRTDFDRLKAAAARERLTISAYLRRLVTAHQPPRR
jgi:hypothetical protein